MGIDSLYAVRRESAELVRTIGQAEPAVVGRDSDLWRANLIDASLAGADLSGATMESAVLTGANLSGAVLKGANLSRAALTGALLQATDFSAARLSGTMLMNASFSDACLAGANLVGAFLWNSVFKESGKPVGWTLSKIVRSFLMRALGKTKIDNHLAALLTGGCSDNLAVKTRGPAPGLRKREQPTELFPGFRPWPVVF